MTQTGHISIEDAALVQRWRSGDSTALERLVGKYQNRIYNVILKMCANPDDAAELTQDTFVKVIENVDTFEQRSGFYTWAFRIAVNLTLNFCKRRATVGFSSLDAESGQTGAKAGQTLAEFLGDDKAVDPAAAAENNELCALVQETLMKLDDEQRAIIVLRDIEGMDYGTIADVLAVELGTVKSRLSRARAALRQIMEAFLR